MVPRPGDPDYIPSHLVTMWAKAGNVWLQQQLRREEQLQQQQPDLQQQDSQMLAQLLPAPAAPDAPVDWWVAGERAPIML